MPPLPLAASFLVAVVLMWASPGPAMTVLLRTAAMQGFARAAATVVGLEIGLYAWAIAAAAGAAALVATSEIAFLVLRVVGAVILIVLGVRALRAARRGQLAEAPLPAPQAHGSSWVRGMVNGLLVQLANPKTATLLISFYPQFVPPDRPLFATTASLGLLQVTTELILYLIVAAGVSRAGQWFRRTAVRRWLDAVSGTVLVGLGARVALLRH
jgi:threonine/homoserine/homoserine lactone efflux protein